jgi:hypothetical protein
MKADAEKVIGRKLNYIDTCTGTHYEIMGMQKAYVVIRSYLTGADSDSSS